jgi:hypothetical protein
MVEFNFQRRRIDKLSREKMLEELENASKVFNYTEFGWRDFNRVANISANPVKKEFGTWKNALSSLRERLREKNLDLSRRKIPPNRIYSDKDMFDEMERIWKAIGHRPSRTEWEVAKPKISYICYRQRFDGWTNACLRFIEYKMGRLITIDDRQGQAKNNRNNLPKREDRRDIPLKLRLSVLKRDNFRCVLCGRSPAKDIGVDLHLDHIIPFSKGGKTEIDNLQTLCADCNLGKGGS